MTTSSIPAVGNIYSRNQNYPPNEYKYAGSFISDRLHIFPFDMILFIAIALYLIHAYRTSK